MNYNKSSVRAIRTVDHTGAMNMNIEQSRESSDIDLCPNRAGG